MRILLALGGNALLRRGEPATPPSQDRGSEVAAAEIAGLAAEHEVVVAHDYGPEAGHRLELALRNALLDRDVVSVLTQVVVTADDPAFRRPVPSPRPHAIAEIRSLRVLVDSGALVICGGGTPVALDGLGTMRGVEAVVDKDQTAALLARRLDADLLVMLADTADSISPKMEAASRFTKATGRRAAIGALTDLAGVVHASTAQAVNGSVTLAA